MKKIQSKVQYQIRYKIPCKFCKTLDFPYIKVVQFKNSKSFSFSGYCRKCNKFLINFPKTHIKEIK